MPYSCELGKEEVKDLLGKWITSPRMRVLDLGCGCGTYGKLIRDKDCHKIGVDAVDYRVRFRLRKYYEKVYVHDIRDVSFLESLGRFDIAIAGDVLEHMSIEDAQIVLAVMQKISDRVLVAFPYQYEQHTGDKWEDHIQDDLTPQIVKERYPSLMPLHIWGENGTPIYGYYIWERAGNV